MKPERTEVDGRQGFAMWVDDAFNPVAKADATLVKIVFDDGDQLILGSPSASDLKNIGADDWNAPGLIIRQPGHDVSDEPRDPSGEWTTGGGSDGDGDKIPGGGGGKGKHPGKGYSKGAYVDSKGVIHTSNVYDAQRALFEDRKVELKQLSQVSTLIKRLGETAAEMAQHGEKAPVFNLCNVSIEGTNLFCSKQLGIPRAEMPVIPAKRTVDFVKHLKKLGYKIEKDKVRADHLRATQSEISGAKVAESMKRIEKGGFYKRLVVSRDDYILDGHHTWAGQVGVDAKDNSLKGDKNVKVYRVDISVTKMLDEANKWTAAEGIAKKPADQMTSFEGYSRNATLDASGVIITTNVYDAARGLREKRSVQLTQPKQVATAIDKLGSAAQEMHKAGKDAENFKLCGVSIPGTNLFCIDGNEIPRIDLSREFRQFLKAKGYTVELGDERAANLRATQQTLTGSKVAAVMDYLSDKVDHQNKPLMISSDDYIIDGHHHWAAKVGLDAGAGSLNNDTKVTTARMNIGVTKLLELAEEFSGGK